MRDVVMRDDFTEASYRDRNTKEVYEYKIPSMWIIGFVQSILAENPHAHPNTCMQTAVQFWHEQAMLEKAFALEHDGLMGDGREMGESDERSTV